MNTGVCLLNEFHHRRVILKNQGSAIAPGNGREGCGALPPAGDLAAHIVQLALPGR